MNATTSTARPAPTAPAAPLPAGVYTWHAVRPYGPSVPTTATVDRAGRVVAWVECSADGEYTTAASAEHLAAGQAAYAQAVRQAVREYPRLLHTPAAPAERAAQQAPAVPVTLTRQRARKLHKVLAALGVATDDRYRLASQIAGRQIESLTALTESEARALWLHARADQQARDLAAATEYPVYH